VHCCVCIDDADFVTVVGVGMVIMVVESVVVRRRSYIIGHDFI